MNDLTGSTADEVKLPPPSTGVNIARRSRASVVFPLEDGPDIPIMVVLVALVPDSCCGMVVGTFDAAGRVGTACMLNGRLSFGIPIKGRIYGGRLSAL